MKRSCSGALRITSIAALSAAFALALGCDDTGPSGAGGAGGSTVTDPDPFASGAPMDVAVPESGRVFVDLDSLAMVDEDATWDLAFEGKGVFTNGGESGPGLGKGFGPLDVTDYASDEVPYYPFLIEDEPGGAFVKWYAYDGGEHVLYGRYHVYGVRRADTLYKVQVLGFYGEVQGAPVAAIYSLRYAAVNEGGVGPTTTLEGVDATAGGSMGTESDPSACLTLATGEIQQLVPAEASASPDWDLCFRRAAISVNGELGGPGGVVAVDLDRDRTKNEKLAEVMTLTAGSELPRFDAVTHADLSDPALPWTGDRIVSAFTDKWLKVGVSPVEPEDFAWMVVGADGSTVFLIGFDGFTGAAAASPGTVHMRVKKLKYTL
jgi:hypothetical protein